MSQPSPLQMDLFNARPASEAVQSPLPPAGPQRSAVEPTLGLIVLGSGSGGNVTLLTCTPAPGVRPSAIVTHFDTDHFRPSWVRTMVDLGLPLFCHRWHLEDLRKVRNNQQLQTAGLVRSFEEHKAFRVAPHITAQAIRLQHDRQGTSGFRFDLACGTSVGFALCRHVAGVDVLCIESNYDEAMTKQSSRPSWVNRRNLSDSGHLSNEQALAAVQRVNALSPAGNPRKVVLLHRSSDCNDAKQVRRCFGRDRELRQRVVLTEQDRAAPWVRLRALPAVQSGQQTLAGV